MPGWVPGVVGWGVKNRIGKKCEEFGYGDEFEKACNLKEMCESGFEAFDCTKCGGEVIEEADVAGPYYARPATATAVVPDLGGSCEDNLLGAMFFAASISYTSHPEVPYFKECMKDCLEIPLNMLKVAAG